ncbi:hypothetical protein QBC36DRAFT_296133 [Triangularia setosa]|uniref:Uncharacterized protein n=1 Tax=Triangularia setosa TaxID=2587417 RepID=A0AAN6VVS3_9PEZI|nr:hypothetical protein QBC36DRAFT_296133 [Podospora setosa]
MQWKTFLALVPLVATALGYVVPEGAPNGFYAVTFDKDGNTTTHEIDPSTLVTIGEPLEERSPPPAAPIGPKFRRQAVGGWGTTGRWFPNHGDYDLCTIGWRNFFNSGNFVPSRTIFYAVQNQAVLAGCNYRFQNQYSSGSFVDTFNGFLDVNHGSWRTGWVHYSQGPPADLNFSFWRDVAGTAFCTNI